MESMAPTSDVIVMFKCTNSSFLPTLSERSFKGNSIIVKNLSKEDKISISNITVTNGSLKLNAVYPFTLEAGESVEIGFTGDIPTSDVYDSIDVTYRRVSLTAKEKTRSFGITLTDDYSGKTETDLTPSFVITTVQTFKYAVKILEKITAIISAISNAL